MIKYTPASQSSSITYEEITISVSSDFDYITVDSDGELNGWETSTEPVLHNGTYRHLRSHSQDYYSTYTKKYLGTFERTEDDREFTPQLWKL